MCKYFFLLVSLLFLKNAIAQNINDSSVFVKILGSSFNNEDTIFISLENKIETKIFIQISLLKKNKNKWQEVLPDIFKINTDAQLENILILKPKEKRNEFWLPFMFQKNNKIIKGKYRFRLKISEAPNIINYKKDAPAFLLK